MSGNTAVDVWPLVSGATETSPRTVVALSVMPNATVLAGLARRGVGYFGFGESIVSGGFKLVVGPQVVGPFGAMMESEAARQLASAATSMPACTALQPPWEPTGNGSGVECTCGTAGCLFDLVNDPHEATDVSAQHPQTVAQLKAMLDALRPGVYAPDRGPLEQAACDQITKNGGFWGPWLP